MISALDFFLSRDFVCWQHEITASGSRMMRDLGKAGESAVQEWCAIGGITANQSLTDRYGWDLLFELESTNDVATASGLHESNIECKVQVKATDGDAKTRKIELSNLRAMATSALPAFYLLLEYGGSDRPIAGHLLHLDNSLCEKILKRIRIETAKLGKPELNRKTMTLSFKKARKIEPLNGYGLKKAILDYVGKSQGDYVSRKQNSLNQVGYEAGAFSVKFNVPVQDIQKFVEMASGTKAQIEVQGINSFQTRFGITEALSTMNSESALLTIGGVIADGCGRVSFINRDNGKTVAFDLDVYRGGLGEWVPKQFRMVRLVSQRFTIDISIATNKCKIWFHKNDTDPASIRDLYKQFSFTEMLTKPNSVDIVLMVDKNEVRGTFDGEGFDGDQRWACTVLRSALSIQNHYENYDDILSSPAELSAKGKNIVHFEDFLSGSDEDMNANISFSMNSVTEKIVTAECIVPLMISFGGVMFISLYVFGGDLKTTGDNAYDLKAYWKRCIYKTNFINSGSGARFCLKEIEKAASKYESECMIIDLTENYIHPIAKMASSDTL